MRLHSTVLSPHFPDPNQSSVLQLGLEPLDPKIWMQVDGDFEQFQQHKCQQKEAHADHVYFSLPESIAAQKEFHQLLLHHLLVDHPHYFSQQAQRIHFQDQYNWPLDYSSLWASALLVQEDICLLEKSGGEYRLTAASVCSPSNWRLEEKIGRNLDFIHRPVPDYDSQLGNRVKRLFDKLKADSPLLRFNWSVQSSNELFWRDDLEQGLTSTGAPWYWRVERQTLRRLPKTQAIVFTIRIYLQAMSILKTQKKFELQLREIILRLPKDQVAYKGLLAFLQS